MISWTTIIHGVFDLPIDKIPTSIQHKFPRWQDAHYFTFVTIAEHSAQHMTRKLSILCVYILASVRFFPTSLVRALRKRVIEWALRGEFASALRRIHTVVARVPVRTDDNRACASTRACSSHRCYVFVNEFSPHFSSRERVVCLCMWPTQRHLSSVSFAARWMTTADLPSEQNLPGDSETEAAPGIVHRTGRAVRRLHYVSNQRRQQTFSPFSAGRVPMPTSYRSIRRRYARCSLSLSLFFSLLFPLSLFLSVTLVVYIFFFYYFRDFCRYSIE